MAKEVKKKDNKKEEKTAKKSSKNITSSNSMRDELKKVTWPTRKELVNSTMAVIVIVVITAVIVFFLDIAFESINTYGINKLRKTVSEKVNNEVTTTQDAQEEVVTDNTVTNEDSTATINEAVNATTETPTTEE